MKKFLLIVVLFVACKKENKKDRVTITVLESGTTMPVSAARVNLMRYDFNFQPVTVFSGLTDENGTVQVGVDDYNSAQKVFAMKYNYWKFEGGKNTTLYVAPEGYLKLRLHPVRVYPQGTSLQLRVYTQDVSQGGNIVTVAADTDSTVALFGFGGHLNTISWQVSDDTPNLDMTGTINNLQVPRFDTLQVNTLEY